jgi:hypothetical protein
MQAFEQRVTAMRLDSGSNDSFRFLRVCLGKVLGMCEADCEHAGHNQADKCFHRVSSIENGCACIQDTSLEGSLANLNNESAVESTKCSFLSTNGSGDVPLTTGCQPFSASDFLLT